jgi:hypothetical protein
MSHLTVSVLTFTLLITIAISCMYLHTRLSERHRDADTAAAVQKIANLFVVITSLVFGLLITSSKSTFEEVDRNIHAYATDLILLDRTLRNYGSDADRARNALKLYIEEAIAHPAQTDQLERGTPDIAGKALDYVGNTIDAIRPPDAFHEHILTDALTQYHDVVRQRWTIVEQSEGTIPNPIVAMLIAWLTIIFASYGYRAPRNAVVISMLLVSAMLISASLYLVLDMDLPFAGPIRISYQPYHRALVEIEKP